MLPSWRRAGASAPEPESPSVSQPSAHRPLSPSEAQPLSHSAPQHDVMISFYNRRSKDRELRVLVVADVHCCLSNVHRLAEALTSKAHYVDMIWVAGDVTFLSPEDSAVPAKFSASEGDMSAVVSALENIQCRVAYVPGKRDPASTRTMNTQPPRLTPHSCNVHNRCLRIAPELVMVGFGEDINSLEAPALERLRCLLAPPVGLALEHKGARSRVGLDFILPGDSVVLLTHSNPSDPSSSKPSNFSHILQDSHVKERISVAIHGDCSGTGARTQAEGVEVLGVGALNAGNFSLLTLNKSADGSKWSLGQVETLDLHSEGLRSAA